MTASVDTPRRGVAPPSVDLAGHFRDLGRVALPALLIGLAIGMAVFGLRMALIPKQYSATVVTQITSDNIIPGDAFVEQLRAPFVALSTDQSVLEQVLSQVDDTDWTPAELQSHITLAPGTSPSLLDFTATAPQPELAEKLARAMVSAVSDASTSNSARDIGRQIDQIDAQITAERARNATLPPRSDAKASSDAAIADLEAQLAKLQNSSFASLSILSAPAASTIPVAPKPIPEGAVAGILGAIVAAELLVLVRGRRGRKPNRIWARRIAHKYDAELIWPADRSGTSAAPSSIPPLLVARFRSRHRHGRVSLILEGADIDLGEHLPDSDAGSVQIARLKLNENRWERVDPNDVASAVVVISESGTDRQTAQTALRELAEIDCDRHLVVQKSSAPTDAAADPSEGDSSRAHTPISGAPESTSAAQANGGRHGRAESRGPVPEPRVPPPANGSERDLGRHGDATPRGTIGELP